jgi:flagellar basal-body rod protein FlgB
MDLSSIPLFEALAKRMSWLTDRQAVLAQNVANADTPGYVAHDLKPLDFRSILGQTTSSAALATGSPIALASASTVALATTQPGHLTPPSTTDGFAQEKLKGESALNGNRVSLEDEMMKVSQTASDYALTTTLYRAHLGLIKSVLGRSS